MNALWFLKCIWRACDCANITLWSLDIGSFGLERGEGPSRHEIPGSAVGDSLSRRSSLRGGSDGAILSGRQSHQVASGAYHLVFRDVRTATFSSRLQAVSRGVPLVI